MTETTDETTNGTATETTETTDAGDTTPDTDEESERDDDHLQNIDAGCGCAEVWETLSEEREE
jgi:hypothetical protein